MPPSLLPAASRCLLIAATLCASAVGAFGSEPTIEPTAAALQPILAAKCGRCHGETIRKADLSFASPGALQKGGESGPVLIAGKPDESLLIEMVESGQMPPDGEDPLEETELEAIKEWIRSGARFESSAGPTRTDHDVLPILLLHCTVCHGRTTREAGLDLRSRDAILAGGKSGPAIVPGKAEESLLLQRVHAGEMPPKTRLIEAMVKPLEAEQIATLTEWIEQGAPAAAVEPDRAGTSDDPLVSAEDRQFWAFIPPRKAAPPLGEPAPMVRSPIDAFLLAKLNEKGLSFSSEADKLTLLRRVTFDLTGLPPDLAEAESFLADERPDAYDRLVDRLLASPAYGERWGRHWLDVAGYADSEGKREQHLPRPFAWRYRDYVVRSLGADKPYDQFLIEQIAGDELADFQNASEITAEMADQLAATGFLRMAPDPTWANLTGFTPDRLEVIADAIDVLGSGVMGLSLKCARCHSHKFDPLPQRDYYRIVAIFKGAYDEHDWLKPEINSYGGAASMGLGERYLPYVATAERQAWRAHNESLQTRIAQLQAESASADRDAQIQSLSSQLLPEPRVMALWDRGEPSPAFLYRRGDYRQAGAWVEPGPPGVLMNPKEPFEMKPPRDGAASTGRRLAFARWLTAPDNPLTARVIVNRIWKHHFGRGLVTTLGNFGRAGQPPTHPELLDWMAREFANQGMSWKSLHRLLVTSTAYRQQSAVSAEAERLDPDNRWLSRMPLRRLDAEELRDSLLFLSGELDRARFGPSQPVAVQADGLVRSGRRRSVYVQQLRKHPATILENFDLPAMSPNCLSRAESLVATQALHLMNDDEVRERSRHLAARVGSLAGNDCSARVRQTYALALGRPPTSEELQLGEQSLRALAEAWEARGSRPAAELALETYCHAMINSAAFLYID